MYMTIFSTFLNLYLVWINFFYIKVVPVIINYQNRCQSTIGNVLHVVIISKINACQSSFHNNYSSIMLSIPKRFIFLINFLLATK